MGNINLRIRNLARSMQSYVNQRSSVFAAVRQLQAPLTDTLSDFLASTMFSIDKVENWKCLPITVGDIEKLDYLFHKSSQLINDNYLELCMQFIETNASHVRRLNFIERDFSKHILEHNVFELANIGSAFDTLGKQSLFYLRAMASTKNGNHEEVTNVFNNEDNSVYVQRTLAPILIYFFLNHPANENINLHLKYAIASNNSVAIKRKIMRFLIGSQDPSVYPVAFISYIGLLSHPYDAWISLVEYFQKKIAREDKLSGRERRHLTRLHAICRDDCETQSLLSWAFPEQVDITPPKLADHLKLSLEVSSFIDGYTDIINPFIASASTNHFIKIFTGLRATRYPDRLSFDFSFVYHSGYWFTKAGKLCQCFMTSIYMLRRVDSCMEKMDVIRMASFLSRFDGFVASSPAGTEVATLTDVPVGLKRDFTAELVGIIEPLNEIKDRRWLKLLHFSAFNLAATGHISKLINEFRINLRVEPDYLTGIDWRWFELLIEKSKLKYFYDKPDGLFLLLLKLIESRGNESSTTTLKVSLEPAAARSTTIANFSAWLFDEYGEDSIAFFQHLLTPSFLMRLEFTESYFEALSERIAAFQNYVNRFGFTKLLKEQSLSQELEIFETELMLLNVGANQFEVAWNIIKSDALTKFEDYYKTIRAIETVDGKESGVSLDALYPYQHTFPTGQQIKYFFPQRLHASSSLAIALIEFFMRHPSQGIESILSVRIRHTNFNRQFEETLENLRHSGNHPAYLRDVHDELESLVLPIVATWMDDYMHQISSDKPKGAFSFIPNDDELRALATVGESEKFPDLIDRVFVFLSARLEHCLSIVRASLANELVTKLLLAVAEKKLSLISRKPAIKEHVSSLIDAVTAALTDKCNSLQEWFSAFPQNPDAPATPIQMERAIRGRYKTDLDQKRLVVLTKNLHDIEFPIPRALARTVFHLVCELSNNALKYGSKPKTMLLVSPYRSESEEGLCFTSSRSSADSVEISLCFEGNPTANTQLLFKEGKSGFEKIAALSASIVGSPVKIRVTGRGKKYRVYVPFKCTPIQSARIVVVEDDELKWREIQAVLSSLGVIETPPRAKTLVEAKRLIDSSDPDLLILDVSMNISGPSNIASRGTHANIGGVEIVERMYLLNRTCPTIVFTGFDLFKNVSDSREGTMDLISLSDKLRGFLKQDLLATVRYGADGWRDEISTAIALQLQKRVKQ